MSIAENVVSQKTIDQTVVLTINRPESLNALNIDVLTSLLLKLDDIDPKGVARSIIITGSGEKSFVAGADIIAMNKLGNRAIAEYISLGQTVMRTIQNFPLPIIAAVNGYALGGGLELALSCDIIAAKSGVKLGLPEVGLGIIPGFGGTQRLLQRAGIGTTKKLVFTGEMISSEEALTSNIIDYCISTDSFLDDVLKIAQKINTKAPRAVQGAKRVINTTQKTLLLAGLQEEVDAFLNLFSSKDREEGMNAFLQKRAPHFTNT